MNYLIRAKRKGAKHYQPFTGAFKTEQEAIIHYLDYFASHYYMSQYNFALFAHDGSKPKKQKIWMLKELS